MKKIYLFAATALLFAACSNESDFKQEAKTVEAPQAVAFDVYTSVATRAGSPLGVMTTDKLKDTDKGFGVFAMYQNDGANYSSGLTPNFMYNEHVKWSAGWTYSPLKYWPNETTKDSQTPSGYEATSTATDKLSFFAYAPYVSTGSSNTLDTKGDASMVATYNGSWAANTYYDKAYAGSETSGILSISAEDRTGDPLVEYGVSDNPDNNVDLLWGVAPAGMSYKDVSGGTSGAPVGEPLLNMVKPDKDQKMKFLFQHALSRIGLTVVSAIDQIAAGDDGNKYKPAETRVLIEEVKIWGNFGTRGVLNLNNSGSSNVANWIETSVKRQESSEASPLFTINTANDRLADDLRYDDAAVAALTNDATLDVDFAALNEGVRPSEKTLMKVDGSSNPRYFMVIPSPLTPSNTDFYVQIKYHVITKDTKLTGNVSDVTNTITRKTSINFKNGKSYNLKLILGLTSVKLDAEVADWQVADDAEVYLPQNKE